MTSTVNNFAQLLTITDVSDVVITDIVDDGSGSGNWVRSIRVFGSPYASGDTPIVEIKIKSTTKSNLDITTPSLNF